MRRERAVVVINVTCDECGTEIDLLVPSSFRGSYDEADVEKELENEGWLAEDGADYCSLECELKATGKDDE